MGKAQRVARDLARETDARSKIVRVTLDPPLRLDPGVRYMWTRDAERPLTPRADTPDPL